MNIPLLIARRYLFAKRSTNAINIITGISVFGVTIGTAALILVLSVFNGFEDLLGGLFGHFNPEIKVTPAKGKTFQVDSLLYTKLQALPGVLVVSKTLEEIAFFDYEGSRDVGVLKGVDSLFAQVNGIDSTVSDGVYKLKEEEHTCVVLGVGMAHKLSVNINDPLASLSVYMPVEQPTSALDNAFKTRIAYPKGVFEIQQEFDNQYILADIAFARELMSLSDTMVSALEIKCKPGQDFAVVKSQVASVMGPGFVIRDQYEQNDAFFKVMKVEKWMGFAITSLMLVLIAFNTLGALWMIVLDKQKDIAILKSMGASDNMVRRIFLAEGLLLTLLGLLLGFVLALILYWAQKQFGLIGIPDGFLVRSYPISMRLLDFVPVTLVVLSIGLLASLAPAFRAGKVPSFLREE